MARVVIRADASLRIGSGHVMRCLTLADELRERGAEVTFVCREHSGDMTSYLELKGHPVVRLPRVTGSYSVRAADLPHAAWLGASWEQDTAETIAAVKGCRPEWLIIDHYAIDRRWEETLRPHVEKIMVIDDLADRPHDCDLLLDQNWHENKDTRYEGLAPAASIRLLGPRYALLRSEFYKIRRTLRKRTGSVERILVFFGAGDVTNEYVKALKALKVLGRPDIAVDLVVGEANPHRHQLEALCGELPHVRFHCQVDTMAEIMAEADLALGAGGCATWERCAVGLPSLVTAVAANQVELAETGARHGLFFYLGEALDVSSERVMNSLNTFLDSPENLMSYSANGLDVVDARGVHRVAGFLAPPRIALRPAVMDDCYDVYGWRNAEETRRHIFDSELIPPDIHRKWFCSVLENPNRVLLVGEIDREPVGVLRYDISGQEALISVYRVPGRREEGIGSHLIRCGSVWLREHHPQIRIITAEIIRDNVASVRAFESAGFKKHYVTYQEVLR